MQRLQTQQQTSNTHEHSDSEFSLKNVIVVIHSPRPKQWGHWARSNITVQPKVGEWAWHDLSQTEESRLFGQLYHHLQGTTPCTRCYLHSGVSVALPVCRNNTIFYPTFGLFLKIFRLVRVKRCCTGCCTVTRSSDARSKM